MAGGTFTVQNKVLPGVYVNIASTSLNTITTGTQGVTTLPVGLSFGASHEVVSVTANTNLSRTFGNDPTNSEAIFLIQEALRGAQTVLVYNLSTGEKASATVSGSAGASMEVTAKYAGTRGNDLRVIVRDSILNPDKVDVLTYLDTTYIDTQTVSLMSELTDNEMVTFSVTTDGIPSTVAGIPLTGGTTEPVSSSDYMEYLNEIDRWQFNTMAITSTDSTVINACVNYVKSARTNRGKFVQLVVSGDASLAQSIDHEAVTCVMNGVKLSDGTELTPAQCVPWVAGASSNAGVTDSLTYTAYPNAVDTVPRLSEEEQIASITEGAFAFIEKRGTAVVLQDINTLRSFTVEKNQDFSKNKIIRLIDDFYNNSREVFEDNYIGQVPNNVEGRELYRSNRISYLNTYQSQGAIEDFESEDVQVYAGETKESVVLEVGIDPVDAMEKLYLYLQVR